MPGGRLSQLLPPLWSHLSLYSPSEDTLNGSEMPSLHHATQWWLVVLPLSRELPESRGHVSNETREAVLSHSSERGLAAGQPGFRAGHYPLLIVGPERFP